MKLSDLATPNPWGPVPTDDPEALARAADPLGCIRFRGGMAFPRPLLVLAKWIEHDVSRELDYPRRVSDPGRPTVEERVQERLREAVRLHRVGDNFGITMPSPVAREPGEPPLDYLRRLGQWARGAHALVEQESESDASPRRPLLKAGDTVAIAKCGGDGPTVAEFLAAPPGTYPEAEARQERWLEDNREWFQSLLDKSLTTKRKLVADYERDRPGDHEFLMAVLARRLQVSVEELEEAPNIAVLGYLEGVAAVDGSVTRRGATPQADPPTAKAKGKRWTATEAAEKGEGYVKRHGYPGLRRLAEGIGHCPVATMTNAIESSTYLKARKAEHEAATKGAPRVVPLSDKLAASLAQPPSDEARQAAIARLVAEGGATERREERQHHAARRARSRSRS